MGFLVSVMLEVHGAVLMRRSAVVGRALLSRHDLLLAELAGAARAVRLVMDEAEREQVHAAAERTAGES